MLKTFTICICFFGLAACARTPFIQSETPHSLVTYRPYVIGGGAEYSAQAAADLAQGWCKRASPGKDAEIVALENGKNGEKVVWRCR